MTGWASTRSLLQRTLQAVRSRAARVRLTRAEEGSSLVEFAVTLSLLLTLLFCFMELCLAFYSHALISEFAREGTRYASVRGPSCVTTSGSSCTATATQINSYVKGLGYPNLARGVITVNTTWPNGDAVGQPVQVQVTYAFNIAMPFVPKNSFTMSSTSRMYIVQ